MTLNEFTRKLLCISYKHRGRGYDGADCYGLILIFYREFLGLQLMDILEEYDQKWAFKGDKNYFLENYHKYFTRVDKPRLYDMVLFQNKKGVANHGGVVLNNGKFIHCSQEGVSINHYNEPQFKNRLNGFYRYKNGLEKKD